jgi:hypothetical protein
MQSTHHVEILNVKPGGTYIKKMLGFKRLNNMTLESSQIIHTAKTNSV